MNTSGIRKIRKRIEPTLGNFKSVYGCYVNAAGEIISTMELSVADMQQEEKDMYSTILKKSISGAKGKRLVDLSFSSEQVGKSDEHRLLMALRDSRLEDAGMRDVLYRQIAESLNFDGKGYVILLAADICDLSSRDQDEEWSEESTGQFEYFICGICPVKEPKAALKYFAESKSFRGASTGSVLFTSPSIGFMFPTLDEGAADIYEVLYYTKSAKEMHEELIEGLFRISDFPLTEQKKKEEFNTALAQSLSDECSLDVITGLQARIASRLDGSDGEDPVAVPQITIDEVCRHLESKGISEEKTEAFREMAEARLGDEPINAGVLLEKSSYKITSSEANITVAPEQAVRIKTILKDGVMYFLVPVGSDVKVNGVDVSLSHIE